MLNETHAPDLKCWLASAAPGGDFPIQNLPFGVFRPAGGSQPMRGGIAIGDMILDLAAASALGLFDGLAAEGAALAARPELNDFMAAGRDRWSALRLAVSRLLRVGAPQAEAVRACLRPQAQAEYGLPCRIGDYTDFFTSYDHMINSGRVFRPDAPPLPNFKWMPIGYHGRASSVEVSGARLRRPSGQLPPGEGGRPEFGPSRRMDYEMELGVFVGPGNARGTAIALDAAPEHLFGVCLLNDWSARDIQAWEALPLGPFLAKNFLTTISPWIVTFEALAPFRSALPRTADDPEALPYLRPADGALAGYDIELEVALATRAGGGAAQRLSRSSYRHAYWGPAQLLAHHTRNGCNLRPGDLLGSGTQSGPGPAEQGCLLELSRGGREPVRLSNGERRAFLEDGDTVVMRGWCERPGFARIGFGECRGTLLAAGDA
ncbi:fumarylacetoacetase [Pseudoduganella namucuonensis]|uniref:fumarylacetoacetase n=1 Tax=Pseudoduganella namucuonensis TaxID=1035707 RepID=A0A1I7L779_9BURK|nr:fumarylacetoacetase [Pseudoduganella namucuonensis]SFV05560.1 fumarylacetoacetate hydrolase [Pseudoduganella namucuonensis]